MTEEQLNGLPLGSVIVVEGPSVHNGRLYFTLIHLQPKTWQRELDRLVFDHDGWKVGGFLPRLRVAHEVELLALLSGKSE